MSDDLEMVAMISADAEDRMAKAVEHTLSEFATVRTGRATPAVVEKLRVEYYGSEVPLQQLAGFSVPEARMLVVVPYDKTSMSAIERAIQASDLGVNPANDGEVLRLVFPPLTEERRRDLVRVVRHTAEEGRVAIRNLRRSARHDLEALEKDKELSSDELKRAEDVLDGSTQKYIAELDAALHSKEEELLEV